MFDIEDEVIFFKLPLLRIDSDRIVYRTESFTPPNILFKIYVSLFIPHRIVYLRTMFDNYPRLMAMIMLVTLFVDYYPHK